MIFFSCEEDSTIIKVTLEADKEYILADETETITFTLKTSDGEDVTSKAIFRVNGETLEGNVFKSNVVGSYFCRAEYKTGVSNDLAFEVNEVPIFTRNVLIENYTATWCGYCPRVHDAIIDALSEESRIIPIAIHGSNDPYYFTSIGTLATVFEVAGYPTAIIDRDYSWPYPEEFAGLNKALDKSAGMGLAINSEISGDNIIANVKVKFGRTYSEDLKLVVCLVEGQLIYNQTNYYSDGRGDPIVGYIHNNVLRKFETDFFGDAIPGTSTVKDNEFLKTITIDATGYIKNNCKIVAFVVSSNNKVINAQSCVSNGAKDYEVL
ncbi:MAG: hypothetical protein A2W99_11045 [Bacteroidetes bacterium GWF2_33_16]|nr:MAG: hypothetical protein A2W99_11045 [Bacteroidetes bacterium GWF2_33_16]